MLLPQLAGAFIILSVAAWFIVYSVPRAEAGERTCGEISFYGAAHQGRLMANGRPFNMHSLTAASWFFPFGTRVRVTAGKKSVVVTITDRGPAKRLHRVIDLSRAAFARLAPTAQGVIKHACVERL